MKPKVSGHRKTQCHLVFDRRVPYGSCEHFFHFMWGYLLPSIHIISTSENTDSCRYFLSSCGPVMNKVLREIMHLCGYHFRIIPNQTDEHDGSQVMIPRWDISLLHLLIIAEDTDANILNRGVFKNLSRHPAVLESFKQDHFTRDLSSAITQVKSLIERKVTLSADTPSLNIYADSYLILSRSPEPKFYSKETGRAEISGYGTSRRALLGVEEATQKLRKNGIPVTIFEPGKFSLVEQIKVFQACKGIIGIKGAEFANLIWLQPQSRVILIKPHNMNTLPIQRCLAKIINLNNYVEIETDQGHFPTLNAEILEQYLVE